MRNRSVVQWMLRSTEPTAPRSWCSTLLAKRTAFIGRADLPVTASYRLCMANLSAQEEAAHSQTLMPFRSWTVCMNMLAHHSPCWHTACQWTRRFFFITTHRLTPHTPLEGGDPFTNHCVIFMKSTSLLGPELHKIQFTSTMVVFAVINYHACFLWAWTCCNISSPGDVTRLSH